MKYARLFVKTGLFITLLSLPSFLPATASGNPTETKQQNSSELTPQDAPEQLLSLPKPTDDFSLTRQAIRMLLALAFVIALIYLLSKFGLSRLINLRMRSTGNQLRVLERISLDTQHAIYIVQINEKSALILGTSPQNIQILHHLEDKTSPDSSFKLSSEKK